jgi:hypothetical protein
MHDDCMHRPPDFRCPICQQPFTTARDRMNLNRLTAAALQLEYPDDAWCLLVQRTGFLNLDALLETQ